MICWDCGPRCWEPKLVTCKHLLMQRVGRMKLRLRKTLQCFFVAAIAVVYTALSHGAPAIARLGSGGDSGHPPI
jgi:hypothetical protein